MLKIILLSFIVTISAENCLEFGVTLYEDLACTAVIKDGQPCPVEYKCEDFAPKNDTCLLKNRRYKLGEVVDNDLIVSSCQRNCTCMGSSQFSCNMESCPEYAAFLRPNCFSTYVMDKCCAVNTICSDMQEVASCEVDNVTYHEGQRYFPRNTCSVCICNKNFVQGVYEQQFCQTVSCSTQLFNMKELQKYCAPVYYGNEALCCPTTWICPEKDDDEIKTISSNVSKNKDLSCRFGEKRIPLGDGFSRPNSKNFGLKLNTITCECVLPPLLTCKLIDL